ncbi:angiopoietin-4-like [Clytia hemisphaerica]|uniref:angiopoietin-4-like n=1 Tax=Clytia hemisphaerica TaxID=252671 RepID=UPI0034D3F5CA
MSKYFTALFHLQLVLTISGYIAREEKQFNLVSVGKEYEGLDAFNEFTAPDKRMCISRCVYSKKCLSYDVNKVSDRVIECRMFNITIDYFLYLGNQLSDRPGVEIQSKIFTKTSCLAWYKSGARTDGVYKVLINGKYVKPVYCLMQEEGGGWMAFQRRFNGSVIFSNRPWSEYRDGFGPISGEHWLGNEAVHQMISSQPQDMMFIGETFNGVFIKKRFANFVVNSEADDYFMTFSHTYPGYHSSGVMSGNYKFTTVDRDNDNRGDKNCAQIQGGGGWWYNACTNNNINGHYLLPGDSIPPHRGVYCNAVSQSLKSSMLLIRPMQQ